MPLPLPSRSGVFIAPDDRGFKLGEIFVVGGHCACGVGEENDLSDAFNSAHVHGETGTFVVSAHSPYDRQMLREHVEILARRGAALTVGMHGTRWIITRHESADSRCVACTQFLGRVSCSRDDEAATTCLDCVMQAANNVPMERHDS